MKRKMNLVSVLLVAFMGIVMAAGCTRNAEKAAEKAGRTADGGGAYQMCSKVQVYEDDDLELIDAYFAYFPMGTNFSANKAIVLNMPLFSY